MTVVAVPCSPVSQKFPKAARLLKSRDFRFRPYKRFQTENFSFLFTLKGQGRLGISISKKVLRRAAARNRIRRLIREVFRSDWTSFAQCDVHLVGLSTLTDRWRLMKRSDVESQFLELKSHWA
jgi:ribonuclease P protein component